MTTGACTRGNEKIYTEAFKVAFSWYLDVKTKPPFFIKQIETIMEGKINEALDRIEKTYQRDQYIYGDEKEDILETIVGKDGYNYVWLIDEAGIGALKRVDGLVCGAFIEGYKEGQTIVHINGDKTDDRLENLLVLADNGR